MLLNTVWPLASVAEKDFLNHYSSTYINKSFIQAEFLFHGYFAP